MPKEERRKEWLVPPMHLLPANVKVAQNIPLFVFANE